MTVAREFPCRVITHETNRGKGAAIRTGLQVARGRSVIIIDADDTYPAEVVAQIAELLNTYDMVVTSRIHRGHIPWLNRIGNMFFRVLIRTFYGFSGRDPLTGLYGIRRVCLEQMDLSAEGFDVEAEIAVKAARMGLSICDLPIAYGPRLGVAKLRPLHDGRAIFRTVVRLMALYNPTLAFTWPGVGLMLAGMAIIVVRLWVGGLAAGLRMGPHSVVLGAMMVLAGHQAAALGALVQIYATLHRFAPETVLTRIVRWPHIGKLMGLAGLGATGLGLGLGADLFRGWVAAGRGAFLQTEMAALSSLLVVLGIQLVFTTICFSVFLGELSRRSRVARDVTEQ